LEIFVLTYLHPDHDIFAYLGIEGTFEDARSRLETMRRDIHHWSGGRPDGYRDQSYIMTGVYNAHNQFGKTVAYIWQYDSKDQSIVEEAGSTPSGVKLYTVVYADSDAKHPYVHRTFATLEAAKKRLLSDDRVHLEKNPDFEWYHPENSTAWYLYLPHNDKFNPFSVWRIEEITIEGDWNE